MRIRVPHSDRFVTAPNYVCCPLCNENDVGLFWQDHRDYLRCETCSLVFVPERFHLDREAEKAVYDQHENSPDDPRYREFLSRLFDPLVTRLTPDSSGLDFGAGPGPTLSVMLEEAGFSMSIYDPFYAPDNQVFDSTYDFITATEVVEHLHQPGQELGRLWSLLAPSGWLGIMTKRVRDQQAFSTWHYKNDPTHVCFFSVETFQWLARLWSATLVVAGDDVVLFQKSQ